MSRYQADSKFVCSIYPGELPAFKSMTGPDAPVNSPRCQVFHHPGVAKGGKPMVVEIKDSFENVFDVQGSTHRRQAKMAKPVTCEEITRNLLNYWAGNMVDVPPGIGPGIMEIANSAPTTAELEHMNSMQTAFFEYMFSMGEKHFLAKTFKEISKPMFLAAEWFGRTVNWASTTAAANLVPCGACKQQIPSDASVCHICGTKLKALPKEIAMAVGAGSDAEIADLKRKLDELLSRSSGEQASAPAKPAGPPVIALKPLPERPQHHG